MKSGIYEIVCLPTGRRYVGSAVDLRVRKNLHWSQLKRGAHHSRFLQRAWKKYGPSNFRFSVLESVSQVEALTTREQHHIDLLEPEFNSCPVAASSLGYRHTPESKRKMSMRRMVVVSPMAGRQHSAEARTKMSVAKEGVTGAFTGLRHLAVSKQKMASAKTGALNVRSIAVEQRTINGSVVATFPCLAEASRLTGVDTGNIRHVLAGRSTHAGGFVWKRAVTA